MSHESPEGRTRTLWFLAITLVGVVSLAALGIFLVRLVQPGGNQPPSEVLAPPQPPLAAKTTEHSRNVVLFFVDTGETLKAEARSVRMSQDILEQIQTVVEELVKGPQTALRPVLPQGIKLQGVFLDRNRIAYLDFSKEFVNRHPGGTAAELLTIRSILRTLGENFAQQIQGVQFLVEGTQVETIAGHVDLSRPLAVLLPEPPAAMPDSVSSGMAARTLPPEEG